ncbi:MAG: hypothetical protein ACKVG6_04195 [Alphaproteobacteria bacterium]|jgi:hypothetical protein
MGIEQVAIPQNTRSTPDVTFILPSFARPKNIQRIVDSVLQEQVCGRVIVCNNQLKTDSMTI